MGCDRSGLSTALGEGVNASTPGLALKAEGLGESPFKEGRQGRQGRHGWEGMREPAQAEEGPWLRGVEAGFVEGGARAVAQGDEAPGRA